jgi:hypothetical protein
MNTVLEHNTIIMELCLDFIHRLWYKMYDSKCHWVLETDFRLRRQVYTKQQVCPAQLLDKTSS